MTKVLVATVDYPPGEGCGGAERQAQLQAEALARRGYRVTVVCPANRDTSSGFVNGVYVRRLPSVGALGSKIAKLSQLAILTAYLAVTLLLLRRYQLIHVHRATAQANVIGLVARIARCPVHIKLGSGGTHGDVWLSRRRFPPLQPYFSLRAAASVQAISEEIALELEAIGIDDRRILRIPNAVDHRRFYPGTPAERIAVPRHEVDARPLEDVALLAQHPILPTQP